MTTENKALARVLKKLERLMGMYQQMERTAGCPIWQRDRHFQVLTISEAIDIVKAEMEREE